MRKKSAEPLLEDEIQPSPHHYLYMVRCADGSLYTDTTDNVERAIKEINQGRGPTYTKTRHPAFLVHHEEFMNQVDAENRAAVIRQMNRRKKEVFLSDMLVGALDS